MKIICIGRNYVAHAEELNNAVPTKRPVVFIKPDSAVLRKEEPFFIPNHLGPIHYELELVLRVGKKGKHIEKEFAFDYIDAATLGIDFTARELQAELKEKGQPWELAKGFDKSAVIGEFIDVPSDIPSQSFELLKNGERVQLGECHKMIFPVDHIISFVSKYFTLKIGDLIFTGTPAGVGPVAIGDLLEGKLNGEKLLHCEVK